MKLKADALEIWELDKWHGLENIYSIFIYNVFKQVYVLFSYSICDFLIR
jgi:hypothetical protein